MDFLFSFFSQQNFRSKELMDVTADVQAEAREKREALKSSLEFFHADWNGWKAEGSGLGIYLSDLFIYGYLQFLQVYKMQWKPCLQKVWMFSWRSWLAPMCATLHEKGACMRPLAEARARLKRRPPRIPARSRLGFFPLVKGESPSFFLGFT